MTLKQTHFIRSKLKLDDIGCTLYYDFYMEHNEAIKLMNLKPKFNSWKFNKMS